MGKTNTAPGQNRYAPPADLSRFALLSIAAALVTMALKAVAAWLTGSIGLLSDAAESLVNLVAAIVAFIVLKIAIRPPDANHPFGHSKAEYFSAAVEGGMIFVAATVIIVSAVDRLIHPMMPESLGAGLAISTVAALINGAVGWVLLRQGRRMRSATLVADGKHLLTDVVTSAAVLVGVGLVALTGVERLDPIVALVAGVNIVWTGFVLIRNSVNGLMDIALPDDVIDQIEAVLDRYRSDEVEFHALRAREAGNRRFLNVHVLVPGSWSVKRGHDLTEDVIDALVEEVPDLRVSAHLEPKEDPRSYEDIDI